MITCYNKCLRNCIAQTHENLKHGIFLHTRKLQCLREFISYIYDQASSYFCCYTHTHVYTYIYVYDTVIMMLATD